MVGREEREREVGLQRGRCTSLSPLSSIGCWFYWPGRPLCAQWQLIWWLPWDRWSCSSSWSRVWQLYTVCWYSVTVEFHSLQLFRLHWALHEVSGFLCVGSVLGVGVQGHSFSFFYIICNTFFSLSPSEHLSPSSPFLIASVSFLFLSWNISLFFSKYLCTYLSLLFQIIIPLPLSPSMSVMRIVWGYHRMGSRVHLQLDLSVPALSTVSHSSTHWHVQRCIHCHGGGAACL